MYTRTQSIHFLKVPSHLKKQSPYNILMPVKFGLRGPRGEVPKQLIDGGRDWIDPKVGLQRQWFFLDLSTLL